MASFNSALSDLGELAAFVALGLTVDLTLIADEGLWWRGLLLAVLLALLIRPLVVGPLLTTMSLRVGGAGLHRLERSQGCGADPARLARRRRRDRVRDRGCCGIVFVVVLFSVVVQGSLVPTVATRLGVPMEPVHRE